MKRGSFMLKKALGLLMTLALIFALAACSSSESGGGQSSSGDDGLVIGTSIPSLEFTFFVAAKKAWEAAANEAGVADAPFYNGENNQSKQNKDIEDMVVKGVDAIVVIPITTEGVIPAIKYANENGVPVFTVDRSIADGAGVDIVAHIGTDHEDMGENAARLFLDGLKEIHPDVANYKVAELEGTPGSSAAILRGKGIHNVLDAESNVEFVSSLTAEFQATMATTVTENILTANPDIHGIIAHNDMMAEGALQAAKSAGRDDLVIVGMDGQVSTVKKVVSGEIYGTSLQLPSMLGDGLKAAVQHLNGEKVKNNVWVPTERIDKSNAQQMIDEGKSW